MAKITMAKIDGSKVITGEVRFHYVNVLHPHKFDYQEEPQYQICILVPKDDIDNVTALKQAIHEAFIRIKDPAPDWWDPLRDGDLEHPEDPAFRGMYYLNAKSRQSPGVVDADRNKITDERQIYNGCYGRASLSFFPFDRGSTGVGTGLNNIQKLRDGDYLEEKKAADEDFEDDDFFDILG